ncbi:hypothetical protein [Nonomuraea sp. NPDC049758]|uniref:hypothetical protein n=1 Tax=Nonomuraea sp. NPDC049758 TaxID=3154360 RepID=UPI0034499FBC
MAWTGPVTWFCGTRIIGQGNRLGTVTGLGIQRGQQVLYVCWDELRPGAAPDAADRLWRDTVRARDVVRLSSA